MDALKQLLTFARENPVYVWLAVAGVGVFLLVMGALVYTMM